jgi:Fibronectin type III domain
VRAALLSALVALFAGCGVQAPPLPPRVQIPQEIKDLRAAQVGRTLEITFTMPSLAIDGELLTKPVQIDIFRAVSPAGQKPAPPDTSATPWLSLTSRQLPRYVRAGKVDYPFQISPQDFRQQQGSIFAFAVVAFTRGFRGHPRKSAPSNLAQATLIDVTQPVTDLAVKTTQTALLLTWAQPAETLTGLPPSHLSGYRVYQSKTGKPGSFHLLGQADSTHFEDRNFQFGRQYYFRVSALTAKDGTLAESEPSTPTGVTPRDIFPPPVPSGLTAVNAAGAVDLLWNAVSASDLAGYNVYRSTLGGPYERINKQLVPTPIFHDSSVAPGQQYQYAVTAVDDAGNESQKSADASVTTPSAGAH